MTNPRLLPRRTPLLLATVVLALAASSAPAYAGGDDCPGSVAPEADDSRVVLGGDDCPPAAPAPVQPAPVPAQPTPAPAQPAPGAAPAAPVVRAPARPQPRPERTTTRHATQRPVQSRVRPVQTRPVVQQQRTFAQSVQTVPRGGVQAGAGGAALDRTTRPSPLLAIAALLLGLLSLTGGVRAMQVKSRR